MQYEVVQSPILYPEVKEYKNGKVKVLDTPNNLKWLLSHFKTDVHYNLMTRKREIYLPEVFISKEDEQNHSLNVIKTIATINDCPVSSIDEHLDSIGYENAYHPISLCVKQNPWDGVVRFPDFCLTLETNNPKLTEYLLKTWFCGGIAAAHSEDGFINHGVLVLHGAQGLGKTSWINSLSPVKCDAIKEGAFLDPTNKDSIIQLASHWIVELAELDSIFKKSEIGRIKSFITMKSDNVRLPYARKAQSIPRRTIYAATVNEKNYLVDETGNRRWWTISVNKVNYNHGFDMKQIWAEIYHYWKEGALTYLDRDLQMQIDSLNKDHEKVDPMEEMLHKFYDWDSLLFREMTATQVLQEIGYPKIGKTEATRMGVLLRKINGNLNRLIHKVVHHKVPARRIPQIF